MRALGGGEPNVTLPADRLSQFVMITMDLSKQEEESVSGRIASRPGATRGRKSAGEGRRCRRGVRLEELAEFFTPS